MPLGANISRFKNILMGKVDMCPKKAFYTARSINKGEDMYNLNFSELEGEP